MYATWCLYRITFIWVFFPKALFLESIGWCIEANFLNLFFYGSTHLVHALSSYDWKDIYLLFYLIFLSVNYFTFGIFACHSSDNYLSYFLSRQIRVVRLYDVLMLSWLGTIRHDTLWNLLMYFLQTYFYHRIPCLNIFQIFMLLLEQHVRIHIILLFLLSPLFNHSAVVFGIFHAWPISNIVIVRAKVQILCGSIFNNFIRAIDLLQPMSLLV